MSTYTIDGYPTDSRLGLPLIEAEEYTFCQVIKNPVGYPPVPSKEVADDILAGSSLNLVSWEE